MAPRPTPYITDGVVQGLMAPRPWNDTARQLKRESKSNRQIAAVCGVSKSMITHFFSPASIEKRRAKRKMERVELKDEPAALAYERQQVREQRLKRLARDPDGERAREAVKRKAATARVKADPKRLAHYRMVAAASARWRRKLRRMIEANPANRRQQPPHASP